jgi:hypothetical protein
MREPATGVAEQGDAGAPVGRGPDTVLIGRIDHSREALAKLVLTWRAQPSGQVTGAQDDGPGTGTCRSVLKALGFLKKHLEPDAMRQPGPGHRLAEHNAGPPDVASVPAT